MRNSKGMDTSVTGGPALTQSGSQQTTGVTLKDQQGVIHVLVITTIKKAELLLPVCGVVGGIDIQQDLPSFAGLVPRRSLQTNRAKHPAS